MMDIIIKVVIRVVLVGLLYGCDNSADDDIMSCTDDFCTEWCKENSCTDAGLSDRGECKGDCASDNECYCRDKPCHTDNCDNWCRTSQGKTGGQCVIFNCVCN